MWQPPQDPGAAGKENCTMQAIISGVVGGGAGMVLGAILAPFNSNVATMEVNDLPMREQFRRGFREMGTQSKSWGKNLMVIGAVFSCSECFVEKTRARTDRWNPIVGGCITGGVLAANGARLTAKSSAPAHPPCLLSIRVCWVCLVLSSRPTSDGIRVRRFCRLLRGDRCPWVRPVRLSRRARAERGSTNGRWHAAGERVFSDFR